MKPSPPSRMTIWSRNAQRETVAKELDKAVNEVIRMNFDLYFERDEATVALKYWWRARMEKGE